MKAKITRLASDCYACYVCPDDHQISDRDGIIGLFGFGKSKIDSLLDYSRKANARGAELLQLANSIDSNIDAWLAMAEENKMKRSI